MANIITVAAETAAHETEVSPYAVGIGALVILFALLLVVLAIGAGREHS